MTNEEFQNLKTGDIVRHRRLYLNYVVTDHRGDHVTAVASVEILNPEEWETVRKVEAEPERPKATPKAKPKARKKR